MHIPAPNWRASGEGPCPQPVGDAQGHLHGDVPMQLWELSLYVHSSFPKPPLTLKCTQFGSRLYCRGGRGKALYHMQVLVQRALPISKMLKCDQYAA